MSIMRQGDNNAISIDLIAEDILRYSTYTTPEGEENPHISPECDISGRSHCGF